MTEQPTGKPAAAFRPEMQVKQFVAEVNGDFGSRWRVFETGDSRFYLFVLAQNTDISKPVRKTDLQPEVRRALAHGLGHAPRPEQPATGHPSEGPHAEDTAPVTVDGIHREPHGGVGTQAAQPGTAEAKAEPSKFAYQAIIQDTTASKTTWTGRTKEQLVAALARKGWSRDSVRDACDQAASDGSATTADIAGDLVALVTFGDTEVDLWDAEIKTGDGAALRHSMQAPVTVLGPVSDPGSTARLASPAGPAAGPGTSPTRPVPRRGAR